MKIITQNFKNGEMAIADVPSPVVRPNGVLVQTRVSLISPGTDRAIIGLAKKSYLGKARDRPDLVRKVLAKVKNDGLWATYKVVKNLLEDPLPIGYSLVGEVRAVGRDLRGVKVGDRVACAGLGHANHAEMVSIPENLFVRVPENVSDEQAAYVTLGAIAMHGVRQADQQLGSNVLVVGLGLVGQITSQLCCAAGLRVIGLDLDPRKLALAKEKGAMAAFTPEDGALEATINELTRGRGVDAVLLTAGSRDSGAMFETVAKLCRDRARVVVVGDVKMDISRRTYFEKELEIFQSRSYGPGRYDKNYEEKGQDYPIGYVRWTERRNMESFLDLIAAGKIDVSCLTTHRYAFAEAKTAYELVTGKNKDFSIGILLEYEDEKEAVVPVSVVKAPVKAGKIGLGIIGTGQFARGVLIPALMETASFELVGVSSARGLSADAVNKRYQGRYATNEPMKLLDDAAVQAVLVATRHDSHARYVIEALKRDKHVFVEKPLCLNEGELQQVMEAARASKGTLTVGFNRRFSPWVKEIQAFFEARQEPMSFTYRINAGRIPLDSENSWVHDPAAGGGRIIGEACHFIDMLQAISGALPVAVSCMGVSFNHAKLVANDTVTMTLRFSDGSLGTIHYWANGDASYPKERLEIFCEEKIAILHNFRELEMVRGAKVKRKKTSSQQKGFAEEAKAFVLACKEGKAPIALESLAATTRASFLAMEDVQMPVAVDAPVMEAA